MSAFSIYVIPDVGDPVYRPGYPTAQAAESAARAEARLVFRRVPEVRSIEIVTIEHNTAISQRVITREESVR